MEKYISSIKSHILIVDDTPENISILSEVLSDYKRTFATNGISALEKAKGPASPDIILLDVSMPEMDGYEVCRLLKSDEKTANIPVIFITAKSDVDDETLGLSLGAVDYITKPFSPFVVQARVRTHLELMNSRKALKNENEILEMRVAERTRELEITKDVTIQSLASLAETRDNETGNHIRRTQNYVRVMAEELARTKKYAGKLNSEYVMLLYKSAPLHDIGKVGIPDRILLKPGPLDQEEWKEMKKHTLYGHNALLTSEKTMGSSSFLQIAREITISHHEKYDGSGYPYGLKGDDIPLSGKLMAFADIYDALISDRVYKSAYTHDEAIEIMLRGDGRTRPGHFDPDLLALFKEIHEQFRDIANSFKD